MSGGFRRVWNSRRLRLLGAVGLLLLGGWWFADSAGGTSKASWIEVETGDLVLGVEVTGKLAAIETSLLGPPQLRRFWEYKISHMAPEGEDVTEGTPVLSFDTSELDKRLQRQQAEAAEARKQIEKTEQDLTLARRQDELRLAEARARLRKAQLKVDRPAELSEAHELAQARLDLGLARREVAYLEERMEASRASAEARLAALRNQRDGAEQQVQEIQLGIERMVRAAPRDGTVIYVTNWRDEKKKVGDACWRGENVIELPDLRKMKAEGQVDEADAGKLAEGQRVTLRLDAHPDVEFTGAVSSIWKTVQRESWRTPQKVVRLEVELDQTDTRRMRPGMRFRGKVETERVDEALLLPIDAVFLTAEGPVVYRRTFLGYETVSVELGRRDQNRVEVLAGLDEGDEVALTDLGSAERRGA